MYKKFKEHLEEQKKDPNKIHHTQYEKHTAYGFKGGKVLARRSGSSAGGDEELEESASGKHYEAIDDVHINLENRNHAIDEYGYGPLNPKESSIDFWKQKAKLWKTSVEEAKKSRCGNCAAFNQSKEILNRIADALGPAGKIVTEKAGLGYCEMFNFKCASDRTCDAWLVNGPITEQNIEENIRRKVIEPLERGEELRTLSFYRGSFSHNQNKKRDRAGRQDLERLRKKGLIKYSPGSGEYSYRHPKKGEPTESKEKSYIIRPGNHPKAEKVFDKVTKGLARRGDQESIGSFQKKDKQKRARGKLIYTTGENKGKEEPLGKVYLNQPPVRGTGRTTMIKGNPETGFTTRNRKYRVRKKT